MILDLPMGSLYPSPVPLRVTNIESANWTTELAPQGSGSPRKATGKDLSSIRKYLRGALMCVGNIYMIGAT